MRVVHADVWPTRLVCDECGCSPLKLLEVGNEEGRFLVGNKEGRFHLCVACLALGKVALSDEMLSDGIGLEDDYRGARN